jgi:hypothetical protein
MFKKILLTSAAALAITVGATTISTPDANAGVSVNLSFGGYGGHHGGHYGGYYGGYCGTQRVLVRYRHRRHFHRRWVYRTYC